MTIKNLLAQQLAIIKKKTAKIITEDELEKKLLLSFKNKKPLKIKLGIDPTAPDIHLGFALVLKKLRDFQNLGHQVILVIGDFTAKIGDPTGKNATRPILTDQEIKSNMKTYLKQIYKILDKNKTQIVYNSQWLKNLNLNQLIEIFSKITLQKIIEREDFQKRLKNNYPLYLQELIYPLIQAYDSLYLKADIELGGVDQELNCLMGRELQTKFNQPAQIVILMPLLIGLDGQNKMSKSLKNYISINDEPDKMFGLVMSLNDQLIKSWFELVTDLDENEINNNLKLHPMEAKKRLAFEIVKQYHGEKQARLAWEKFEAVFQRKNYDLLAKEIKIKKDWLTLPLVELLYRLGLVKSKSEIKRLIQQGGVEINHSSFKIEKDLSNFKITLNNGDLLRLGKKNFYKIIIEDN